MSSETTITLTGDAEKVASILLQQRDAARDEADRLRAQVAALLRVKEAAEQARVANVPHMPEWKMELNARLDEYAAWEKEHPDGH